MPTGLSISHARDAGGLPAGGGALVVLGIMIAAALLGWLGGKPQPKMSGSGESVELTVDHPAVIRSGMFFETRIDLVASHPLGDATIAMTPRLWRSVTINTQIPQAAKEEYADGYYRFHFGPLATGEQVHLKLDAQINPDLFGGTRGNVAAFDGDRRLVVLPVAMRVLP